MAIKKTVPAKSEDDFISGAPDAGADCATKKGDQTKAKKVRERQEIVAVGFPPAMIEQLNSAAECLGLSRSAWVVMICAKALKDPV